jgi:hypothetical protein
MSLEETIEKTKKWIGNEVVHCDLSSLYDLGKYYLKEYGLISTIKATGQILVLGTGIKDKEITNDLIDLANQYRDYKEVCDNLIFHGSGIAIRANKSNYHKAISMLRNYQGKPNDLKTISTWISAASITKSNLLLEAALDVAEHYPERIVEENVVGYSK